MRESVQNLEELFDLFNNMLYNGELTRPIISIQTDTRKSSYGWCTTYQAWESKDGQKYYEINIVAEYMARPLEEICETLLHEMAHLYNIYHEIKDCTITQYHNAKFKEAAEKHGLVVEKTTKYGWSKTTLNDELREYIDKNLRHYHFNISRVSTSTKKTTKKKYHHNYMCPCCGSKLYSAKEINVICEDCNMKFEEY